MDYPPQYLLQSSPRPTSHKKRSLSGRTKLCKLALQNDSYRTQYRGGSGESSAKGKA